MMYVDVHGWGTGRHTVVAIAFIVIASRRCYDSITIPSCDELPCYLLVYA